MEGILFGEVKDGMETARQTGAPAQLAMTEEIWRAIIGNDPSLDGRFVYGVKTTGIFCRPSCKSRQPAAAHVHIFKEAQHALAAGFRPCKRCKPEGSSLPDEEWVAQAVRFIEARYTEPLTLAALAETVHGSPWHLHRTFKRIMKVTPLEYIQRTRIAAAKKYLCENKETIGAIALSVGISNAAHFATLFRRKTGCTPADYRLRHGKETAARKDGV